MQTLSINKGQLVNPVSVPPSKSYANRALIFAAVSGGNKSIRHLPSASDVTILVNCLKAIGLKITEAGDRIVFENSFPECETGPVRVEVGEGGTTARFLACMLLSGSQEYKLVLGERLKDRPWNDFIALVRKLEGTASLEDNILTLKGPLKFPEILEVDCSQTTQFATGFKLMSRKGSFEVKPTQLESSQSYWAMTEKLMTDMSQGTVYSVPLDWSSAGYPLAFAALNQKITFPDLHQDEFQADSKFFSILEKLGCISEDKKGISVTPTNASFDFDIDVSDCLDLVPTLGYFLAHVQGKHILRNVQNLVFKESDRLNEVMDLLKKFGRKVSSDGKTMTIEGHPGKIVYSVDLILPNDHRMVMAGTLFLLHHSGGSVSPASAVGKSYPDFFKLISC